MKSLYEQIIQDNNLSFITVTRTANQITLKINYTNLNYSIDSTENGWYINMENFGSSGIQGAPDLPYRNYMLELPSNVDVNSINESIINIYSVSIGAYNTFKPVIMYSDSIVLDEPNEEIYNTNNNYPLNPISSVKPSIMRNWIFLGIELYPFQYNPVSGNLTKIDSIEYVINFDLGPERDIPFDSTKVPGYCIITTQAIKDSSAKLEEFQISKERIGFDCFVITVDSLDNCNFSNLQEPGERPERIRRYLQENYVEKNLEYVLFIGDPTPHNPLELNYQDDKVPMKSVLSFTPVYKYNSYKPSYFEYVTDYYYADLTGNWDLDNDGIYGEINSYLKPNQLIDTCPYSIKYEGWLIIPYQSDNSSYSGYFEAFYSDGFKLYINDSLLSYNNGNGFFYWTDQNNWDENVAGYGRTSYSQQYYYSSGDTLKIKIEYRNKENDGFIFFRYSPLPIETGCRIPNSWFRYGNTLATSLPGGLKASFYNNYYLTDTAVTTQNAVTPSNYYVKNDVGAEGIDIMPELYVGRIPVYNNEYQIMDSIIDKMISYQFTIDVSWRKRMLLPMNGAFINNSYKIFETGECIRKLDTINFDSYRLNHTYINDPIITNRNQLIDDITIDTVLYYWNNYPMGLVSWIGHGDYNHAWPIAHTDSLNFNSPLYPSIVFQGSCLNGYPYESDNLGTNLLRKKAIATISASNVTYIWSSLKINQPNNLGVNNLCYFFSKNIINNNSIGQSLYNCKAKASYSPNGANYCNIFAFNIYGDASLKLNSTVNFYPLQSGWNFISSYLIPDRNALKSLLSSTNGIGIVKNQNDDIFIPDSIDEIGIWNYKEAYKIYMNNTGLLFISGSKANPILDTIQLNSGWNWVSYLRNSAMLVDTSNALKSIKNNLIMAKNETGLLYIPQWGINQIGNMIPNQGYEISVNAICNLVYPQDSTSYNYKSGLEETTILSPVAKRLTPYVTKTGNDCTLIFDDLNIPDGYEIGIINGEGILIGAGAVQNQVCALTVWGKDILNNSEGAVKGEELFAFTIDTTNNRIQEIKITNIQDYLTKENLDSLTYEKGKIYVCNANAELNAINENMYITNQPNPFNDQTEITYKIPEAGNVVVNISSIHGEIVATYNQGNQAAGIYNILFDGSNLLGGVYVLDLILENERVQSIMILIK